MYGYQSWPPHNTNKKTRIVVRYRQYVCQSKVATVQVSQVHTCLPEKYNRKLFAHLSLFAASAVIFTRLALHSHAGIHCQCRYWIIAHNRPD